MKLRSIFAIILAGLLTSGSSAQTFTFLPTSGNPAWNVNGNWDMPGYPDASGVAAILPVPSADLTIDLGEAITVGSLTINKATSGNPNTTLVGSALNSLTFDGGTSTLTNGFSSTGTGLSIVNAPVVFNAAFTVTQGDNDRVDFLQPLSGAGSLTINRLVGTYSTVVALNAANSYSGVTTALTGSGADDSLVVRLGHADAIPTTTNISMSNSAIIELAAGDFLRAIGSGPNEIQFSGAARNGWGAFGADRVVNLGGNMDPVVWGSGAGQANFGQLVLGNSTSTAMVDFKNPLDLNGNRNIRSYEGTADIDGRISGSISGAGSLTKINDGVLSLAAANTYTGNTIVQGGTLRLDHVNALPATNLQLGSGGVLGIGVDTTPGDPNSDFARDLGTGAGQIQLTTIGGGGNATNAGFSAHGGNRSVVLSGGGGLIWGSGSFLQGTGNRQFILSGDSSDSTLDFKNPIDLAGANRTVVARNGSAVIDAKLSGVISGTGAASGLIKDNPGTLELSNANTYGGITRVTAGVLLLTNATAIPGGFAGGNTGNIEINSSNPNNTGVIGLGNGDFTSGLGTGAGQFQIIGNGGFAAFGADRIVNLGGDAQVTWASGGFASANLALSATTADAAVDFQNPIDLNLATRVVQTRNGTSDIDGVLSGVISGAGGGLDKQGGGTLVLTGDNTYDDGTTITEGRLLVNNSTGSGTGSGPVTVNAGTLGGTGAIAGTVTVNSGAHIAPGASIESLDMGSLTLSSGSLLDFELGAPITSDLLNVTNVDGLTINGGTVNLLDGGGLGAGTYTLIDYAGTLMGSAVASFLSQTPTGPAGFTYSLSSTGGTINLSVTAIPAGIPGDYNDDDAVDAADYVVWRKYEGTNTVLPNDPDGGTIGANQFNTWRANFGLPGAPGGGEQSVPEPATLALLGLAAPFIVRRKATWTGV